MGNEQCPPVDKMVVDAFRQVVLDCEDPQNQDDEVVFFDSASQMAKN